MSPDADNADPEGMHRDAGQAVSADRSVWLIWAGVMLAAIAVLPFAARSQDVVRAIATMCGFTIGGGGLFPERFNAIRLIWRIWEAATTSQMIANSIIVVGFFSAVAFLFTAAAATALAWFKINLRVEELSGKVDVLDVDLSALTKDFHDFRGVSDDRHARLLALIEEQAAASAEQKDMLVKHGEMMTR